MHVYLIYVYILYAVSNFNQSGPNFTTALHFTFLKTDFMRLMNQGTLSSIPYTVFDLK